MPRGMTRSTGDYIDAWGHLQQSIQDILTTPIGTRVHRRDYGSRLPRLVDRPMNPSLRTELVAATAEALERWEPRLKLDRVLIEAASEAGHITLTLWGTFWQNGRSLAVSGLDVDLRF